MVLYLTTLKQTKMDANVTTHSQILLNQDSFHEARRKRDKTNDKTHRFSLEQGKHIGHLFYKTKFRTYSGRNAHYGGYPRNGFSGTVKAFRVVRDRRGDQSISGELNSSSMPSSTLTDKQVAYFSEKRSTGALIDHGEPKMFGNLNRSSYSASRHAHATSSTVTNEKKLFYETNRTVLKLDSQASRVNACDPLPYSTTTSVPSNSFGGLYSSDPVHVPSDNRPSSKIGAIKREVGADGVQRQPAGNSSKSTSISSRPSTASKKVFQSNQTDAHESVLASLSTSRSFSSNHNRSNSYPTVNHQKATQTNKEWRPKSSQNSSLKNHGITGMDTNTISSTPGNSLNSSIKAERLPENFLKFNILENQHVIIPGHLQVPEAERAMLTFGSFGSGIDSPRNCAYGEPDGAEQSNTKSSLSVSAPPASSSDPSCGCEVDLPDDLVRNLESDSPSLAVPSGHPFPEKEESSETQDLETYSDYALVQDINLSKPLGGLQQQQQDPLLHDVPFFKTRLNNTWRSQDLLSSKEVVSSHGGNATTRMVHQQSMGQFYPPVHLSQFPNLMPCRQVLSPVFLPTMAVPGYSHYPAYSHPLNGGNFLVMPECTSQYKPIPSSSPTGFGTYANSLGYALNTQGTGVTAFEDSTAMKYKEGYFPNRQVDASEFWVQTPQEIPGFQSSSYYKSEQAPNAAYLPVQNGHSSFNVATTHPAQIQFSGLYHPSQPPLTNPHQLAHGMPGNIGVGMASASHGAQVGAYQQSQMNHLSWPSNY
ncbi:hypothetical protein Sjap_019736 [Stephania japonica]|uniref:GBF-interacting protein 1 N-terminal domain-containing protein n=1 Tax=Stephania japonica TaxID=461633 RepID=A0AAP0F4V0_9MAGN